MVICQHCGGEAPATRVMCPQCRRRMRPASEAVDGRQPATDDAFDRYDPLGAPLRWEPPSSTFREDFKSAVRTCRSAPGLVLLTVLLSVITALILTASTHKSTAWLSFPGLVVEGFVVGFSGTQRIWLLDAKAGKKLSARDAWKMTWSYFGRFLRLGLMVAWPIVLIGVPLLVGLRKSHGAVGFTVFVVVYDLVLDMLLTFVAAELTFFTSSARAAWQSGRALLGATWRRSKWCVLTPGLALIALGNTLGRLDKTAWQTALVGGVSASAALVLKGTILNYYVRIRPQVLGGGGPGVPWRGTGSR